MNPAADTARPAPELHVLGAFAIEVVGAAPVARDRLSQSQVGTLAHLVARDLADFAPEASTLELVTVGAHYDPVELLRSGWPLHRELADLAARAPRGSHDLDAGRIIAFGANDSQLPGTLTPSPDYIGGPLRLMPFVLTGKSDAVARVGDAFEKDLIEVGMAAADTALAAQDAFGLQVEHARYLTMNDLAAMTSIQYDHAGLGPLWPVLETALLRPDQSAWLDQPPEPLLHYTDREVRIALFSPAGWQQRYAADERVGNSADGISRASGAADNDAARARHQRQFQHFQARQRQIAAVLGAHGVPVQFVHCDRDTDCRAALD